MVTRRQFLAFTAVVLAQREACGGPADDGRVKARPGRTSAAVEPGQHPLGLGADRDGVLYVPRGHTAAMPPAPLLVMMHGAGGRGRITGTVQALADEFGVAVLAPDSRGGTWGIVLGDPGPDVRFIDSALAHVFARYAVDPRRLVIAGFSDGASCALWVGTVNGDVFTHIAAFSPGFLAPGFRRGSPRIFVSHRTSDQILPIDRTSRRLVPSLRQAGYRVTYREFDGPHTVAPSTAREAFEWFTK